MRDVAVVVLLFLGVAFAVIACLGIAVMRGPLARLHYTGLGIPAAVAVAAAITVREGFSLIADKAITVAVVVVITSPVIVQVVARATRVRDRGGLDIDSDDVERAP